MARRKPNRRPSSTGPSGKGSSGKSSSGKGSSKQKPPGQVGRRPSRPGFLLTIGLMWIAVAVIELFALSASWRFVPAIVFAGIGVFFLRGAAVTVTRRDNGQQSA